jgi:hypothetical protein
MKAVFLSGLLTLCLAGQSSEWSSMFVLRDASGVSIEQMKTTPSGKESLNVMPNPFNPSTVLFIRNLDQIQGAILQIFDIHGTLVSDLSNKLANGNTSIKWEAEKIGAGLYFACLKTANGKVLNQKMVLVR